MKEQKFKLGDKAFILKDKKILAVEITGVFRSYGGSGEDHLFLSYYYYFDRSERAYNNEWYCETEIFPTKEALIASL